MKDYCKDLTNMDYIKSILEIDESWTCPENISKSDDSNVDLLEEEFLKVVSKKLSEMYPIGTVIDSIEIMNHDFELDYKDSGDCGTTGFIFMVDYSHMSESVTLWKGGLANGHSRAFTKFNYTCNKTVDKCS